MFTSLHMSHVTWSFWWVGFRHMYYCFFLPFSTSKNEFKKVLNFCLKKTCDHERGIFFNGLYNNTWISNQNMGRTFFHILLWFYYFYQDSPFMENVEEILKIEEYSSLWYCIDLWSSNLWKKERKFFFLKKILWHP